MTPTLARPTVRIAIPDDYDRIGEISVAAYLAGDMIADDYELTLRNVADRAEQTILLVADLRGEVAGAVAVVTDGPYAEVLREPGELEFRMLAVDPAAQDAGVGAVLIDAVLGHAVRAGKHRVVLCTLRRNLRAQGMYERRGFVRLPDRDFQPNAEADLIAMGLDLPRQCTRCGTPLVDGREPDGSVHEHREPGTPFDPPRFCPVCARRLVVQVMPGGWTAECSRHGDLAPLPADDDI